MPWGGGGKKKEVMFKLGYKEGGRVRGMLVEWKKHFKLAKLLVSFSVFPFPKCLSLRSPHASPTVLHVLFPCSGCINPHSCLD